MKKEFTVAVYIIHQEKVLLLLHSKLKKWLPPGGHIEANESPPEAARREVKEETDLEISFIRQENVWVEHWNANSFERPFMCQTEEIPAHKGEGPHQHLDFIYLAYPVGNITPKGEGDVPLRYFTLDEVQALKSDVEIFAETQEVLRIIFEQQALFIS